jgi:predicted LPLAT superfamily acyltransferase
MSAKWSGKTKGSLFGYKFFVFCIKLFGVRFSYFFCLWVSGYFLLFSRKQTKALFDFYNKGLSYSKLVSLKLTPRNFYRFGQILIDRIALKTKRKRQYTHTFDNEEVLLRMKENGKGGFLISAHVGNWENAGNLLGERITSKINVVMLDAEVEKIKGFIAQNTEVDNFSVIPIKEDMSHLVLIHSALKRNEFIAVHADRIIDGQKYYRLPFFRGFAQFPAGPFILACKFKVPVTFVFGLKTGTFTYGLSATELMDDLLPEDLALKFVHRLEEVVRFAPDQWFNFFEFYVN